MWSLQQKVTKHIKKGDMQKNKQKKDHRNRLTKT